MAVNLQLAQAFVGITVDRSQFNTALAGVIADLNRLKGLGTVGIRLDRAAASSSLNLLQQQINALKASAVVNVRVNRPGGGGAGGGGGGFFGGGGNAANFGMGVLQGLGLAGFAVNPVQAAGSLAGGAIKEGWMLVGEGIRASAETAMDLQVTFLELQRVTGESAENIQNLKKGVFDIAATNPGVTVADVTGIMMGAAKAGVAPGDLELVTRSMTRVKTAIGGGEGLDAGKMTEDLTRMLNLFHQGPEYIEAMGSGLVRMANVSTASAGSIADMTMALSGTMANLGASVPATMAFASVLADAGLTAQQGASSFSQIFRLMAGKGEKFAGAAGVPVADWGKMMNTGQLLPALKLLVDRFKEIQAVDPSKAQEWLAGLGLRGVRTAGAFQQVAAVMDKVAERQVIAEEEERTLGALTEANRLKGEAAAAGVQKLQNAFVELKDAIGENFLGPISAATAALTDMTRATAAGMPAIIAYGKTLAENATAAAGGPVALAALVAARLGGAQPEAPKWVDSAINELPRTPIPAGPDTTPGRAGLIGAMRKRMAEHFLPSAADMAAAEAEVGEAKVGAGGKVAARDEEKHREVVFQHARRIQAERQAAEADFARAVAEVNIGRSADEAPEVQRAVAEQQQAIAEDNARRFGVQLEHYGKMALGVLFAQPEEKAGTALGLANQAAEALGVGGGPLRGAGRAFAGLGLDLRTEAETGKVKEEKQREAFRSQTFGGGDELMRSIVTEMLTGHGERDAEKEANKQRQTTNEHLAQIRAKLLERGKKGDGAAVFVGPA